MFERISPHQNLLDLRPSGGSSHVAIDIVLQCVGKERKLSVFTARFRNALKRVSRASSKPAVLIEAKSELEHGQLTDWSCMSRHCTRKDLRKADMRMFLARNEVISNSFTGTTFIRLPGRLWELTQIPPKHEFVKH